MVALVLQRERVTAHHGSLNVALIFFVCVSVGICVLEAFQRLYLSKLTPYCLSLILKLGQERACIFKVLCVTGRRGPRALFV